MASFVASGKLFLIVICLVLECSLRGLSYIYVPLHWTHLNPLFHPPSKTTPSPPSILVKNVLPKSQLNIICPNAALNPVKMSQSLPKSHLYENLWVVDKQSFDTCNVDTSKTSNRLLLKCDTPMVFKHYSLVFLEISPAKQFMEFQKGKDYYFISTSDGTKNSLTNTQGGHCATGSMKFIIHVCMDDQDPKCQDNPPTTTPPPPPPTTTPTTAPTTIPTTHKTTTTTTLPSTVRTPPTESIRTTAKTRKVVTLESEAHRDEENSDVTKRDEQTSRGTEGSHVNGSPAMEATKNERSAADIARDATWFILMAVMGALLIVSISCNLYTLCVRNKNHRRSDVIEDKRSSAAHTLLRDNSKVDRV